jgi:hypothetical protein
VQKPGDYVRSVGMYVSIAAQPVPARANAASAAKAPDRAEGFEVKEIKALACEYVG